MGELPTARAEVESAREDRRTRATRILNGAGESVLTGRATTYTVPLA